MIWPSAKAPLVTYGANLSVGPARRNDRQTIGQINQESSNDNICVLNVVDGPSAEDKTPLQIVWHAGNAVVAFSNGNELLWLCDLHFFPLFTPMHCPPTSPFTALEQANGVPLVNLRTRPLFCFSGNLIFSRYRPHHYAMKLDSKNIK